jgi:chaperone LolA
MRKFGVAAFVLMAIVAIALVVRSQVRDTPRTSEAAGTVATAEPASAEPMASVPVSPDDSAVNSAASRIVTPVAQSIKPADAPVSSPDRPVVSAHFAPLEQQNGAAILKRAAAAYAKVKSMRADFVQLRENPLLGSKSTSRGTLYQRAPDRFALKFSQPAGDVIMADGRYFWVYYPSVDRRQVIRAPASAEGAGAVDLQSQFIGDPVRRFTHTLEGTQKINGRDVYVLTLIPRTDAGYKSMKVWVDARDALVRRFQITEPTGAVVEFQLSNLVINPALGNDVFKFTPPADARIIER